MADSPRSGFTLTVLLLALLAAGVAAALALTYLTSPLDDPTLTSPAVAVQDSAGDAVFAALVAAALSALVIASLHGSWRPGVRAVVRLTGAGLMTGAGLAAALSLDPASAGLQSRVGIYAHGEGRDLLVALFTPWVERMAALAWLYTACGAALFVLVVVATLASRRTSARQPRSVARPA